MVNTASKLFKALCSMVVMLALVASITSIHVSAASHGIYTATAAPHYRHPNTGVIEDSGGEGSAVLGQSMTDSATDTHALVEVDANGNTYATIRLKLSQYTSNQQFYIDTTGNGSYTPVSATIMQEDYANDTTDYRIKVPSESTDYSMHHVCRAYGTQCCLVHYVIQSAVRFRRLYYQHYRK